MGRKVKIENRNAILKAAYLLFITNGYENVPTTAIAKAAELDHRVLFRYFGKKDDILTELIARIEMELVDYLSEHFTDNNAFNFTVYFMARVEFTLMHPDYFRLRASIVRLSNAFMQMFTGVFLKIFEHDEAWKSSEEKKRALHYLIGGTQMIQYEFISNFSSYHLPIDGMDFLTNYSCEEIPRIASEEFRRYMEFAAMQNLRIIGYAEENMDAFIERARQAALKADIKGFRAHFEQSLDFLQ